MKSRLLPLIVLVFFSFFTLKTNAQVGINTTAPDASSALDIQSTEAGLLIPRMTTAERSNYRSGQCFVGFRYRFKRILL